MVSSAVSNPQDYSVAGSSVSNSPDVSSAVSNPQDSSVVVASTSKYNRLQNSGQFREELKLSIIPLLSSKGFD